VRLFSLANALAVYPRRGGALTSIGSVQIGEHGVLGLGPTSWYWTGR
jgi:hypothetical protein